MIYSQEVLRCADSRKQKAYNLTVEKLFLTFYGR